MLPIAIFSDLDGCLLNKSDYSFEAAVPVLKRISQESIPLVLASSKTETEMRRIADEMELQDAPLICENGGVVFWARDSRDAANELVLGVPRSKILELLASLKSDFQFRSFVDLGVEGVAQATDLPMEQAADALNRSSTEPLLWDDKPERTSDFRDVLEEHHLTFTRGGRFWHVAGKTTKGAAMQRVWDRLDQEAGAKHRSLAIGDSPIDQSMLDIADYPIGIPSPDGVVHVRVNAQNGIIANEAGASGWADSVAHVLNSIAEG